MCLDCILSYVRLHRMSSLYNSIQLLNMAAEYFLKPGGKQVHREVYREDGKKHGEARTNSERRIAVYTVHSGSTWSLGCQLALLSVAPGVFR